MALSYQNLRFHNIFLKYISNENSKNWLDFTSQIPTLKYIKDSKKVRRHILGLLLPKFVTKGFNIAAILDGLAFRSWTLWVSCTDARELNS